MFNLYIQRVSSLARIFALCCCLFFFYGQRANAVELEPVAALTVDVFSNIDGGNERGTSVLALLDAGLDIRFSDTTGFFSNIYVIGGEDPSVNVGDFNLLNNNAALDTARLYRAYLYTMLAGAELHVGLLAVDDEFMLSEYASQFINSGFGIMTHVSGNLPIPNYPVSAAGVFLRKSINESLSMQVGFYDGNTLDEASNRNGLRNSISSEDGIAIFSEATLNTDDSIFKAGFYVHTGELDEYVNGGVDDGNEGFYLSMDRAFSDGPFNRAGGWFVRAGYSMNDDVNVVDFYGDTGVVFNAPLASRADDVLGFAVSYTDFGDDFVRNERVGGGIQNKSEVVLESMWNMSVTEYLNLIYDIQHIINPANARHDATVLGVRVEMSL